MNNTSSSASAHGDKPTCPFSSKQIMDMEHSYGAHK
jgi:ornithine--oxo-acid transaminase